MIKRIWLGGKSILIKLPPAKFYFEFKQWATEFSRNWNSEEGFNANDKIEGIQNAIDLYCDWGIIPEQNKFDVVSYFLSDEAKIPEFFEILSDFVLCKFPSVDYSRFPTLTKTAKGKLIVVQSKFKMEDHYKSLGEESDILSYACAVLDPAIAIKFYESIPINTFIELIHSTQQRKILADPNMQEWLANEPDRIKVRSVYEAITSIPGKVEELRQTALDKITKPFSPKKVISNNDSYSNKNTSTNNPSSKPPTIEEIG